MIERKLERSMAGIGQMDGIGALQDRLKGSAVGRIVIHDHHARLHRLRCQVASFALAPLIQTGSSRNQERCYAKSRKFLLPQFAHQWAACCYIAAWDGVKENGCAEAHEPAYLPERIRRLPGAAAPRGDERSLARDACRHATPDGWN